MKDLCFVCSFVTARHLKGKVAFADIVEIFAAASLSFQARSCGEASNKRTLNSLKKMCLCVQLKTFHLQMR